MKENDIAKYDKPKAICPKCGGRLCRWENLSYTAIHCVTEDGRVINDEFSVPFSELKSYGEAGLQCQKCSWDSQVDGLPEYLEEII